MTSTSHPGRPVRYGVNLGGTARDDNLVEAMVVEACEAAGHGVDSVWLGQRLNFDPTDLALVGDEDTVADGLRRYAGAGATEIVLTAHQMLDPATQTRTRKLVGALASANRSAEMTAS
jgi:hypothetical protein